MVAEPELLLLGAAIAIGLVQLMWSAAAARRQQDMKWAAGARDEEMPITGIAARLDRAFRNFMETFPLFAAAVLAVVIAGKAGPLSLWGAALYVVCRALYAPIYAAGTYMVRSLIWTLSLVGLGMVVAALFLA
ncbi:MAG: MAPEG family protein [Phenylobacterium sp.]